MKTGNRDFATYVYDNNGTAVPAISGGFNYQGNISGQEMDFSTVSVVETSGAGWYLHNISVPVGDGYLKITHDNPLYVIQPDAYLVNDVQNHDNDDIYAKFLDDSTTGTTQYLITNVIYDAYANDDFIEPMAINANTLGVQYGGNGEDLTGWSVDVASTTVPVSGAITITDELTREVLVSVPKEQLPDSLITGTATAVPVYFHIQGTSPTGKKKTVGKFTINLNKDYNTH